VALERHHARAHQAVLQFGDDARLLQQQVLRFARQVLEQPSMLPTSLTDSAKARDSCWMVE
jgi:hypothetical protein